jgi:hypothetical protein
MYQGDRRRKEDARRTKQEAKRQRKLERKESGSSGPEMDTLADLSAPGGGSTEHVWFSPSKNRTLTTKSSAPPAEGHDWVLLSGPPKDAGSGA